VQGQRANHANSPHSSAPPALRPLRAGRSRGPRPGSGRAETPRSLGAPSRWRPSTASSWPASPCLEGRGSMPSRFRSSSSPPGRGRRRQEIPAQRRAGRQGKPEVTVGGFGGARGAMERAGKCLNADGAALVAAQRSRREAFARLLDHVSASDCEQRVQVSLIGETERPGFGAAALAVPMAGARPASWAPPRFCFMLPGQPALVPGNHRRRVNSDVRQRLSRLHACAASSPLWTNSPPPATTPAG